MIAELFAPKSRGSVTLKSANAMENPVVDCNYLTDPLDVLVLSEACRYGNEVVMEGAGTKDIVKGSWPPNLNHHTYKTREEWVPYVKEHATTCEFMVEGQGISLMFRVQVIMLRVLVLWERRIILWLCLMRSCGLGVLLG